MGRRGSRFPAAGEAERIEFLAACSGPGLAVQVWYLTGRRRLAGQTVDARGLRPLNGERLVSLLAYLVLAIGDAWRYLHVPRFRDAVEWMPAEE